MSDETAPAAKNTKEADIWTDVARKHFEINGEDIIKTVCSWANDKPPKQPAKTIRGKTSLGFQGTGWGGRTIADESSSFNAGRAATSFQPSHLERHASLTSKLKHVLSELENNSKARPYGMWDDYGGGGADQDF